MPTLQTSAVFLLGVTGGVGTGKSTTAQYLVQFGIPVADSDEIAREVVVPGEPALDELRSAFGAQIIQPDGSLNRARLAEIVFADPSARQRVESILHPRIRQEWLFRAGVWRAEGRPLGAVVIPLLYETEAQGHFDGIACIACHPETQRIRLRARGWSTEHLKQRIAAQWPLQEKILRSDFVIWSEPPLAVHGAQVRRLLHSRGVSIS